MSYSTDGSLPKDVAGYPAEGLYVPNVGTVAAQGNAVSTDGLQQPYAATVVQTVSSGISLNDGLKASYSAAKQGLVAASSATDIFTITGSSTKTIRVTRIELFATTTSATPAALDVLLLKRSTANTAGTSTGSPAAIPHDSTSAAASATVLAYTANPTTGTLVGNIRAAKYMMALATQTATDFPMPQVLVWDFGARPSQGIVVRGTSEVLAINLNAATPTATASFNISIEWTEE